MKHRSYATARQAALCVILVSIGLTLSACRSSPGARVAPPPGTRPGTTTAPPTTTRYAIDSQRSEVLVLVYRDGRLAHLGHNHVIAVRNLTGAVNASSDPMQTSLQMDFPVDDLSVDDAQLRAAQGADFQSTVDEAAVAGTRDHMLGASLLDSKQYPQIHLQSEQVRSADDGWHILTRITVRDTTAQVEIPASLQRSDDELTVSGEFDLTHAQLGLTPYSVALGALKVAERMHVRYRLVAQRER
jgi:polyisoprenoid-binding protein YceI